jgi:hypothetical protein
VSGMECSSRVACGSTAVPARGTSATVRNLHGSGKVETSGSRSAAAVG